MKSILLSVKPYEAMNILNGKQTIIIKKSAPKETPFKVYLYCTKDRRKNYFNLVNHYGQIMFAPKSWDNILNGKVVAEFVCESVIGFDLGELDLYPLKERFLRNSKLTEKELKDYIGKGVGKAIHITDLKIYDEPKSLDSFTGVCKSSKRCGESKICSSSQKCLYDNLTKPPATWMYVKER